MRISLSWLAELKMKKRFLRTKVPFWILFAVLSTVIMHPHHTYYVRWSCRSGWSISIWILWMAALGFNNLLKHKTMLNIISQLLTDGFRTPGSCAEVRLCGFCAVVRLNKPTESCSIFMWGCRFQTHVACILYILVHADVLIMLKHTDTHTHRRWCKVMFLIKLEQLFLLSFWKWLDLDFIFHQKMFAQGFVICNEKITVP